MTYSKNILRSIFTDYYMIEAIKIEKNIKIVKSVDSKTMKNVLIKMHRKVDKCTISYKVDLSSDIQSKVEFNSCRSKINHSNCHNMTHCNTDIYQMIKLLNQKILPTVILEINLKGLKIAIQEVPDGKYISEIEQLTIDEFFMIFNQLLSFLNLLQLAKIKIPEISHENLVVNNDGLLRICDLKYAYFVENCEEFEKVLIIKNFFNILLPKVVLDEDLYALNRSHSQTLSPDYNLNYDCNPNYDLYFEKSKEKFKLLQKYLNNEHNNWKSLSEIVNICEIENQHYSPLTGFLDYLVIHEIHKFGLKNFNIKSVNDNSKQEFFMYRLVEKYISDLNFDLIANFRFLSSTYDSHSLCPENNLDLNRSTVETYINKNSRSSILKKARSIILNDYLQYSDPYCQFLTCRGNSEIPFVKVPFYNCEKLLSILKVLKILKIQAWEQGNSIIVDDSIIGLNVRISIDDESYAIFYKNSGETEDFLRLASELIEVMKYLNI